MAEVTEKDIYAQQYAHFGRMNDLLYKMPPIFSTILGGLWYFAASYLEHDKIVSVGVFAFAAISGCCFIVALTRFRLAFDAYIDNINRLDGAYKVTIKSSHWPSTISAMIFLVGTAVLLSAVGALYAAYSYFPHAAAGTA